LVGTGELQRNFERIQAGNAARIARLREKFLWV